MQAAGGSFDRRSLSVFVVNIGMWDGVLRLKFGSCILAVVLAVSFLNMVADAALSKYAVVLFGSGGSSSGLAQPGGSSSSMHAFNMLKLLCDLPAGAPRQLVFATLPQRSSLLFFKKAFCGNS